MSMYYVMIAERSSPAVARNVGLAQSSTEARRLAQQLDLSMHGRISGRLFYLDEATFLDWCSSGRAQRAGPGTVISTSKRMASIGAALRIKSAANAESPLKVEPAPELVA
jgi:hypothetical protein